MMNNTHPRVLIISHNALSDTQNNGKTLSAFFRPWNRDDLAQLYLTTDVPDFSLCRRFFQITDIDILKRAFFNKRIQGRQVTESDLHKIKAGKNKVTESPVLKLMRKNISPLYRLSRDWLWNIAGCRTSAMMAFVDEFKPQVVFFQSSSGVFAYSLVKWICLSRNIPLIMQTTDDYVSGKFTLDPFFWVQHIRLKCVYKWAVAYSDCIIAIGDRMATEYRSRFGGNYFVAMNSVPDLKLPHYAGRQDKTIKFLYAGNLGLGRWKVLALIAECLKELQEEESLSGELAIYSLVKPDKKEMTFLNNPPFSSFKGALNTDELNREKTFSDILVHVEAFDRTNRHITRLSISTKIPEYLASGRCIFAVGPKNVASMQYITEYDLGIAVMSNKKSAIKQAMKTIMLNHESRAQYAVKGTEIAKLRHNADKTAESILQIIMSTVNKAGKV